MTWILSHFYALDLVLCYIKDFSKEIPYMIIFYDFMKSGTPVNIVNFAGSFMALPILNAYLLRYRINIAPRTKFCNS